MKKCFSPLLVSQHLILWEGITHYCASNSLCVWPVAFYLASLKTFSEVFSCERQVSYPSLSVACGRQCSAFSFPIYQYCQGVVLPSISGYKYLSSSS